MYTSVSLAQLALTCKEEEYEHHDHSIAEVQDGAGSTDDLEFGEEIVHSVDEQVNRCKAARQEGSPPPVIVLRKSESDHKHTKTIFSLLFSFIYFQSVL